MLKNFHIAAKNKIPFTLLVYIVVAIWCKVGDVTLDVNDRLTIVDNPSALTDRHICAALHLIRQAFPAVRGVADPVTLIIPGNSVILSPSDVNVHFVTGTTG